MSIHEPCPAAIAELHRLVGPPRALGGWLGRAPADPRNLRPADAAVVAASLKALAATRDWRAVPYILWLLPLDETRTAVASALGSLMPRDAQAYEDLAFIIRLAAHGSPAFWQTDKPSPRPPGFYAFQAAAWLRDPSESSALAGILSFSANGHVREIAVRALARFEDGTELPFLLLRCNDWVDPVASLARQACVARLHAGYELHFAERFLLVAKLRRRIRRNHHAFVRLVENFLLLSEAGQRAALSVLAGKDRHLRRAVAEIIRRAYPANALPSSVTRQLLSDADPMMRAYGVDALEKAGSEDDVRAWIRRLIAMRMTSARRRAWALAEARAPSLAAELAPRIVFDRNPWLREFARQRLRERGVTDFAALYREALRENRDVEGALLGLMEVGSRGDVALVEHYLDDPSTAVRCASLRAVVHLHLHRDRAAAVLLRGLASPRTEVRRLSAALIVSTGAAVTAGEIEPLLDDTNPDTRLTALGLLTRLDRWSALAAAVPRRRDPDPRVSARASRILETWKAIPPALYTSPSPTLRAFLLAALPDMSDIPQVARTLSAVLARRP